MEKPVSLENYRFAVNRDSLEMMKTFRETLPLVEKKYPEVKGIGFFGSRTVGLEGEASDMDTVIFYDGTRFVPPKLNKDKLYSEGIEAFLQATEPARLLREEREDLERGLISVYSASMQEIGLPVHYNGTIKVVDISQDATDKLIEKFITAVKNEMDIGKTLGENNKVIGWIPAETFTLLSRFFLAVGQGVYENRAYILNKFDSLEKEGKEGARYFATLMDDLGYLERGSVTNKRGSLIPFAGYPKTIDEARKFFFTRPQESQSL